MKAENTKVNWLYVLLFYILAFFIAAPFNSGLLSQKYQAFTKDYLLSDWTYLPAGFGTLIAASVVLFLDKRHNKTITFLGNAPIKNTVIALIPLLVFIVFGLQNARQQNTNYYAFVFASINLIYALMEEIGWRGYLQDALRPLDSNLRYILIGVLWWAWHFRFFTVFELVIFPLICIVSAFLIGKFAEETKSFLTAAGLHSFVIILTNSGLTNNKIIAGVITILVWLGIGKLWKTKNAFEAAERPAGVMKSQTDKSKSTR
ncbi:MAG: CPBP family intramembrane metalloprotease [Acidobacteriota bacterium]|nr:CPBP family intramembrane metalloprotease [Acidobacteriota bacterium]